MTEPTSVDSVAQVTPRPFSALKAALGLAFTGLVVFVGLEVFWLMSAAPGLRTGPRLVEISPGLGLVAVVRRLEAAEVIQNPIGFMALAAARGTARTLKAGEYEIPQGASAIAVLALLETGKVVRHPVLLREGATIADAAKAIEAERLAAAADVLRAARDRAFLQTLEIQADSLEGYLFPDTYQFVKGMTPREMLARMVARMREQMPAGAIEAAKARGFSLHQLLTLASIIEREAVGPAEMPLISAVFWNRLKLDMPLQADPTVQYAVGKEGRALTKSDLQVESPFNTYRQTGLPPGPIGSPGRAAIEAAARPAAVDYLYFVASRGGKHRFSTSLAEHNVAVTQYRLTRPR
ncbi:MAG TPA: endolytic transglycosylase MltG [Candidatus Limnocylindrales bacterium]|nr:endolytic transglycosylase MltG [Candidatus Limnocylindrales bacterium]